jgi:3-oxoacyl-[acyl-carrier protein] reductase
MGKLDGSVTLVTGASRGIGAAIATAFGREGAMVAVNYHRSPDRAAEVVAAIEKAGGKALALGGDVADGAAVRALVERTVAAFGPIDVLVNNAGILNAAPLDQMSDAVWDEMMATNLRSVFLCARAVLPAMLARGRGKIINVTSQLGQKGMPNHSHYAAAKAGVIGFTRALAREVGPRGIHVNAIAPGPIETELIGPSRRSSVARRPPSSPCAASACPTRWPRPPSFSPPTIPATTRVRRCAPTVAT